MVQDRRGVFGRAARRSGERSPRKLFVDVSVIARRDAGTGIQRVVRSLWMELRAIDLDDIEVVAVAGTRRGGYRMIADNFLDRPLRRLPLPFGQARMRPTEGDVFLGLDLAAHILPHRVGDIKRWQRAGVSLAFVLYDLLPIRRPEWFSDGLRTKFTKWLDIVGRRADYIVCISQAVADDFRAWLAETEVKRSRPPVIDVMRLGAFVHSARSSTGMPADAQDMLAWIRSAQTTLMVGTIEPRKGYDQALAAFDQLWADKSAHRTNLLIVGRPGWQTEAFQHQLRSHAETGRRLNWIPDASDEYLEALYAACDGLLLASRGEGFGLPLVEAAAYGKPIIARDIAVFREVAPSGVSFFSGDDPADLATALRFWLAHPPKKPATVNLPGWDLTAGDLLSVLGLGAGTGEL